MQNVIISKWLVNYKDWELAITEDKKVIDIKTMAELVPYWNNGTISYRLPKCSKRIGVSTIRKHCVKKVKVIQDYMPF